MRGKILIASLFTAACLAFSSSSCSAASTLLFSAINNTIPAKQYGYVSMKQIDVSAFNHIRVYASQRLSGQPVTLRIMNMEGTTSAGTIDTIVLQPGQSITRLYDYTGGKSIYIVAIGDPSGPGIIDIWVYGSP